MQPSRRSEQVTAQIGTKGRKGVRGGKRRVDPELSAKRAEAGRRGGRASARRRGSLDYVVDRVVEAAGELTDEQRGALRLALLAGDGRDGVDGQVPA